MVPYAFSGPSLRRVPTVALLGVLLPATLAGLSCEKMPLLAPANTLITLVSTTNVLPINGTTDIIAVLIENGTTSTGTGPGATTTSGGTPVHNGTLVTFTTSLGRIEPAEARTRNGSVTVKLVADGRSGTATVSAFSGAARQTLAVLIGAAAAERVAVTATPSSVAALGGTAVVSARVEDANGNALFGVPVVFTTTAGTLSASSAVTGESGIATTVLTTNAEATVTASAGGKVGSAIVRVKAKSTVTVTVPAASVFVGAPATFTVTPGTTTTMANVLIEFGDGGRQNLGAISGSTSVAHFYSSQGVFQVRVTAVDTDGGPAEGSGSIAVVPFNFSASGSPTTGAVGSQFSLSVTGVPATVPIDRYEWDFGDGVSAGTAAASTTHSYNTPGPKTITVRVVPFYGPSRTTSFQVTVTPVS